MRKKLTLLMLFICLSMSALYAQYSVTGNVTDADGEPLIGVAVQIKGSAIGTLTDLNGDFKLNFKEENTTLVFAYLGFADQEVEVNSQTGKLSIQLEESQNNLDEVVISGLASSVKRSNLANSVASISSKELTGITVQATMDAAMYGKLKGAEIRSNSGAPGGGMSVKLRGVTSIFGDQQPLYIVDGIYIDNSTISLGTNIVSAAAGGGNQSNQDDASNRIADLVTEDIESIEVLKGASASAIYGSRAAGGVVIIQTKRGRAGKPVVGFNQVVGVTTATRFLGQRSFDQAKIKELFGVGAEAKFEANGLNDYEQELYGNKALAYTSQLYYSGGTERTQYYLSGMIKDDKGIVDNTGYKKGSFRLNLDHEFTDWLSLNVSSNYINATADRGFFNNGNTNTTIGYAAAFTPPWENLYPDGNGNYPAAPGIGSNILETVAKITNRENVNRFINGARANIRLLSNSKNNLQLVLNGGRDQYSLQTTGIFPGTMSFYSDPASLGGVSIQGNTINKIDNYSAFLIHSYFVSSKISLRTQVGLTAENFSQNSVISTSTGLNGGQTNLSQAANQSTFQNITAQKDRGFFVQEEFNFNDQIVASVGLRGDKSTNNGDANKLYYYPKLGLAVNLHEFDFWTADAISQFKLRAAYGEAGRFANFPDRFNTLGASLIDGNSGLITGVLRGNTNVGPERQKELELGTDLAFFKNMFSLEFTYYNKNIEDVLLRSSVPTSTGFTTQVVNAASLNNKGYEVSFGIRPVQGDLKWTTQFNFWKNNSMVTRLDVEPFNLGGFAASLGQYRIEEGKSATQIVGTYDPADCETGDCSDLDPTGSGFTVYGDAEPDFNLSWINSLAYKDFELSFVWHWKKGGDNVNLSTLLYDLAGFTWDYDDKTLDPTGELGNGDYRQTESAAGNASPWIEDASYLRLREIGLFYNINRSKLNDVMGLRVGVSGRNLLNFFEYNSYDPEVSNFGGNVLANAVEVTPFPASRRVNLHVSATF